ncbi:unnamed protein product [Enterobius vermicularis]|uniref:L51_S25_CI-B8 domain-containing protein n=1 Tax=Enterobius vermicularis TaxID=51028 RepID=A0A0N4UY04_ENTVE|nr:unnamed protein product [Enterobius vermicularis]
MSSVVMRGLNPRNGFTASTMRFAPTFRVLHISWTHNALMSEGVQKFVEKYLPTIRANNPNIEYRLYRTHIICDPFVVGEYVFNRTRKRRCSWLTSNQVLAMVEEMSVGGNFYPGYKALIALRFISSLIRMAKKLQVNARLPRGIEIWNSETIGHDVFKVYSKWKGDPPDPDEIQVHEHPNYVYKQGPRKKM